MRVNETVGNKNFKASSKAMMAGWVVATSLLTYLDAPVVAEMGRTRATFTVATTRVEVEAVGPFHHVTAGFFNAVVHTTEAAAFYDALWSHIDACAKVPFHRMPAAPHAVRRFKVA